MSTPRRPVHPALLVASPVAATLCFSLASQQGGAGRWLWFALGLVLLVAAIVLVARFRGGSASTGWRPSRDRSGDVGDRGRRG